MITVNGLLARMSPSTMVALLGDIVKMGVNDATDKELVSLVASELISDVGADEAFEMLDEANVSHRLIDSELEDAKIAEMEEE